MKKQLAMVIFLMLLPVLAFSQFKSQVQPPKMNEAIVQQPSQNIFFGLIDPDRFHMSHTFSMSYMGFGGHGMMVNSYMNTIHYQISAPLLLRLNVGLMNSPYSTFKNNPVLKSTRFFGSAELMYKLSPNTAVKLGVSMTPGYPALYSPYLFERK